MITANKGAKKLRLNEGKRNTNVLKERPKTNSLCKISFNEAMV